MSNKKLVGEVKLTGMYVTTESIPNELIYSVHIPVRIDSKIVDS